MADACEDGVNDVLGGVGRTGQQEREPKQRARVRLIDVTKGLETARSSGVHVRPEGNSLRVVHTIITHEQPEPLQRICHDSAMLNLPEPGVVPVDSAHGIGQAGRVSVLAELFVTMAAEDRAAGEAILAASPSLVTAGLARADEFFVAARRAQVYEGDTALHAASFCYDADLARELIARGADVRARNRRGAEPPAFGDDRQSWSRDVEPVPPTGGHRLSHRRGRGSQRDGRRRCHPASPRRPKSLFGRRRDPPATRRRSPRRERQRFHGP